LRVVHADARILTVVSTGIKRPPILVADIVRTGPTDVLLHFWRRRSARSVVLLRLD
jgi:hypothetical protein